MSDIKPNTMLPTKIPNIVIVCVKLTKYDFEQIRSHSVIIVLSKTDLKINKNIFYEDAIEKRYLRYLTYFWDRQFFGYFGKYFPILY